MRALLPARYTPREAVQFIGKTRIPNVFDHCLQNEKYLWNSIIAQGLERVCCPKGRAPYTERPYIMMPDSGRRFKTIGTFAVAGATYTSDEHVVVQFPVPVGYDGVVDTVTCGITANGATGFVEGSGTLVWRVATSQDASRRYLSDLGNIQFSLGSLITPIPTIASGWRIYSGNLITIYVVFPASGFGIINSLANIVCSLGGWTYSR